MLTVRRRWAPSLGMLLTLSLACVVLFVAQSVMARSMAAMAIEALVPGCLLAWLLLSGDGAHDWLTFVLYAVGLGLSVMVLGTFFLHMVPGPLSQRLILLSYGAFSAGLLAIALLSKRSVLWQRPNWTRQQALAGLAILLVAMALRLPRVGYSEFQGDEGRAVLRAAEVLQGNDEVLLLHKKGPVEILLPAGLYAATQRLTEWTARMPFALANVAFLAALMVLGRRLLVPWAGLVASGILAVDGFMIGFSRLVQYQSVVLLMTTLVILAVLDAVATERLGRGQLMAAAIMAAVAMLAHYEGIFFLPPVVYLLWQWRRRVQRAVGHVLQDVAVPVLCGAALVAAFYVPFVLHPQFSDTAVYLGEKRVGQGLFYSNLADFFERASFYSSSYYVVALCALLTLGAAGLLWRRYRSSAARVLLVILAVLWLTAAFWPSAWQVGGVNLTIVLFVVTLAASWLAVSSDGIRTTLAWFAATALLYFFMMTKVHTHYYVALPAWALLVAQTIVTIWREFGTRRWPRAAALAAGIVWWALSLGYCATVFLRAVPEFKFSYPSAKPALYWTPYSTPPRGGYFGFPYRTAWKAIGVLYKQGILRGAYDSNQEDLVTNWYTRGALRCPGSNYFIVARDLENPHAVPPEMLNGTYWPMIEITRAGQGQLWVFAKDYTGAPESYAVESMATMFDRELSAPRFRVGAPLDEPFAPQYATHAQFGDAAVLQGWSIDRRQIEVGGEALLTLYWRSTAATDAGYKVFGSIGDENPVALIDSVPQCGQSPTYRWLVGQATVDRHILMVSRSAADGVLPLRIGMYDQGTGNRLIITDAAGEVLGKTLHLADLRIGDVQLAEVLPDASKAATFGRSILVSPVPRYDLDARPGQTIEIDITWYAADMVNNNLTVFVHCVGPDGQNGGQIDTLPRGGALPTHAWQPGEQIDDIYAIEISADAPVGDYRLLMGLYDSTNGVRQEVALMGEPQPDGMLEIGRLHVGEGAR